jgi:hypothetical protein
LLDFDTHVVNISSFDVPFVVVVVEKTKQEEHGHSKKQ